MQHTRAFALFLGAAVTLTGAWGCELIAQVDRSKIPGAGGAGGGIGTGGTGGTGTTTTSSTGGTGGKMNTGGTGGTTSGTGGSGGTGGTTTSSSSGGGSDGGVTCTTATDCPGADDDCQKRTCDAGACGTSFSADGTQVTTQTAGDCMKVVCDGAGQTKSIVDDNDLPDDKNPCTDDVCTNGVPTNPSVASGVTCGTGLICDGNGACVGCVAATDCPGQDDECQTRTCDNGTCGFTYTAAGVALTAQTDGDCKQDQCDGLGNIQTVDDDNDLPVDNKECTKDTCSAGSPSNPNVASGTSCTENNGKVCNGNGACVECVIASTCPGQDTECQTRTCIAGICGFSNTPNGTAVSGQTTGDCKKSVCNGSGAIVTVNDDLDVPNDSNPCTNDLCNGGVASHTNIAQGVSCGTNLICDGNGTCTGCVTAADCPGPDNECQTRTCNGGMCGFNFATNGTLVAGQTPNDCKKNVCDGAGKTITVDDDLDVPVDDGNACTAEVCNAGVGSHAPKSNGTACNDNDACTQSDSCQNGVCVGANPVVCGAQDQCHVAGTCDSTTGQCTNPAKQDGTGCNDGNAQTKNDVCTNGVCAGVPLCTGVTCTAQDQCHAVGTCDPTTGACSNPAKQDGTGCDDGVALTKNDVCTGGVCAGVPLCTGVICVASDDCHDAGVCDPTSGVCSNPAKSDGSSCDDGNAQTKNDVCTNGVCGGVPLCTGVICVAQDQCHTAGTCDPTTGACSNPQKADGTTCNDGNALTKNDVCTGGVCAGVSLCTGVTCSAQDQCHTAGTCDPTTGACSNPPKADGTTCNDGNALTKNDVCTSGVCAGVSLCTGVTCTAQDQCHDAGTCDPTTGACSNPQKPSDTPCSGGVCDAAGACVQCNTAAQCTGSDTECQTRTCNAGVCGFSFAPANTPVAQQFPGDCKKNVCDGAGSVTSVPDDDPPTNAAPCTTTTCVNGAALASPAPANTPCNANGGSFCNGIQGGSIACVQCNTAAQCTGQDTECQTRTCNSGACGFAFQASGTPTSVQTPGDCKQNECDGSGNIVTVAHDADLPADDGNECTSDTCSNGAVVHPAEPAGFSCSQNGGSFCDGASSCVQCNVAADCPGTDTTCQFRTCSGHVCGMGFAPQGTLAGTQTPNDCRKSQCDGAGNIESAADDADLPVDDNKECTSEVCTNGVPSHPPRAAGSACSENGGSFCDGSAHCLPTSFLVLRLGDGSASLSAAATAGFLEKKTLAGVALGSPIALPTAVSGSNRRLTFSGSAANEGNLSRAENGAYVVLAGYDAAVGTASVSSSAPGTVNRVVGRVDALGNLDATTALNAAFGSGVRSAATSDGSAFWVSGNGSGAAGGVHYTTLGATGSTQILSSPTNVRFDHVFAGQLYASSQSGAFVNVFTVGSGLPTTAGQTATSLAGMPTSGANPNSFVLFDRNANVPGVDTLYVADESTIANGGGVQKWTLSGGTWTKVATFNVGITTGVRGLAGIITGSNVTLIATTTETSANKIVVFVDDGSASPAGTVIATAATNTVYRGVAISPN